MMAGAGSVYARPTGGGGGVVDPRYQPPFDPKKAAIDAYNINQTSMQRNQGPTGALEAARQGAAAGLTATSSYRDPITGQTYTYGTGSGNGRAGGGAAATGGGELEDFDFASALARVQPALPHTPAPATLPPRVQASSPADAAAAEASEFGRAKDRIGRLGRGSLTALQEEFSARGFGGSNMEAGATQSLLSDLQGQAGEVIRDQNIQGLQRRRQVEDRNYAGDINQRGQDIGFTTTTRGQDINAADNRAQLQVPLLQLIAANRRRRLY